MTEPTTSDQLLALEQRLLRRVERERTARKEAEDLLENKSLDLYLANRELQNLNSELEKKVTDRTQALSEALQRAEYLARAKSDFLATMSHELRTPMNAVVGLTDILLKTSLNNEQHQLLKTLSHSSGMLLTLINDILDFAKIDSQQLNLDIKSHSVRIILHDIQKMFALKASSKQLDFSINIDEKLPAVLQLDGPRIKQVLFHLVSNALKFTEQGHVRIHVSIEANQQLLFEIIDTGIGIAPEMKEQLFEAFTQVENALNRKYQGTGLGLALSAKVIRAMQSKLQVESQLGQGSRFYFILPMVEPVATPSKKIRLTKRHQNRFTLHRQSIHNYAF